VDEVGVPELWTRVPENGLVSFAKLCLGVIPRLFSCGDHLFGDIHLANILIASVPKKSKHLGRVQFSPALESVAVTVALCGADVLIC
jgi:hypothetical protein